MNLQAKINEQLKAAMLSKNTTALITLRSLKSAIANAALSTGNIQAVLSDLEILNVIRKQIKQREDSVSAFLAAKRNDLAEKEITEISVLQSFLPKNLTDDEVNNIINTVIAELSASSKKQMGQVIKRVAELANGRIDNKIISAKVGALLN